MLFAVLADSGMVAYLAAYPIGCSVIASALLDQCADYTHGFCTLSLAECRCTMNSCANGFAVYFCICHHMFFLFVIAPAFIARAKLLMTSTQIFQRAGTMIAYPHAIARFIFGFIFLRPRESAAR